MSGIRLRARLSTRLMRRRAWIAFAIMLANIAFVAIYDASDRNALLADVVGREIQLMDTAVLNAPDVPPTIQDAIGRHFADFPDAYGYVSVDETGRPTVSINAGLIPETLLDSPIAAGDWIARKFATDTDEAFESHVVERPERPYRV